MGLPCILAMTAAEFSQATALPEPMAWMACHFSGYGLGLSNLPQQLPKGSYLILNDRMPISGHDPDTIQKQLLEVGEAMEIRGILLDFQRPGIPETASLVNVLAERLPWSVAVSEHYEKGLHCPIFLSAPPPHKLLSEYISPWLGREIWLEVATETEIATITNDGSTFIRESVHMCEENYSQENQRHMDYRVEVLDDRAVITMNRRKGHIPAFIQEAETLGIAHTVGLYQQLKDD